MDEQLRYYQGFFETRGTPSKIIGSIPYNSESEQIDGYIEILRPGVFLDSLKSGRVVKAYLGHDRNKVLGSTASGTLKLTDTPTALKIELDPGETSWGADALKSVARGDVTGFSFAFSPVEQEFSADYDYRYILKANLYEVSPVSEPAYSGSKAYARSKKNISSEKRREKLDMKKLEATKEYWKTGGETALGVDEIEASYGHFVSVFKINRGSLPRAFDELMGKGFVQLIHHGGIGKGDRNLYKISNRYLSWEVGADPFELRPKRENQWHQNNALVTTNERPTDLSNVTQEVKRKPLGEQVTAYFRTLKEALGTFI